MRAIVVGTGAAGAMAAKQLAASGAEVHLIEAGEPFKPLTRKIIHTGVLRRTGLFGDERTISKLLPHMQTTRCGDVVTVRGVGAGGCTTISCGNMAPTSNGLEGIVDLSPEFAEIASMLPICTIPRERWRPTTADMFDAAEGMGLEPRPTPKAMRMERCSSCGMCELGCAKGARWDSRTWVNDAVAQGAMIHYGSEVAKVVIENGHATGVTISSPMSGETTMKADQVVLAAGGIGTAAILLRSGLEVSDSLWIDPVITFGGVKEDARQLDEMPMSWYLKRPDYIVSPYLDLLSHFFQRSWNKVGVNDRVGVMVKLADEANGIVDRDGNVQKSLTDNDKSKVREASEIVENIMSRSGVKGPFEVGMINGGHLGGTLPLVKEDAQSMHPRSLPEGLWVGDLSLVPRSQGMPTMMLAAALGLKVSRKVIGQK